MEENEALTFVDSNQMNLADQPVYASAHVSFDLKKGFEKRQIEKLLRPLKILSIVPLDDRIFQLAYPMCIAEYFQNSVFHIWLFSVCGVVQDCLRGWDGELRRKPFDRVYVNHSLHVEQINGNLDGVPLADLVDGLDVWAVDHLGDLEVVEFVRVFEKFQLLLLFLLVLVHPHQPTRPLWLHVHLVVRAVLRHRSLFLL